MWLLPLMTAVTHAQSCSAAVDVLNDTDHVITSIRLSAPGAENWATSVSDATLDPSEALDPGEYDTLAMPCGTWDVRLADVRDAVVEIVRNQIAASGEILVVAD